MDREIDGLTFRAPDGFEVEETMLSLRAPEPRDLKDPRLMQRQLLTRPNLVVHRKRARPGADLATLAAETSRELADSITGLTGLDLAELAFEDGAPGVLLTYEFPATHAFNLRQYFAIRLDGGMATTLTLTTVAADVSEKTHQAYVNSLRSARLGPPIRKGD